MESSSRALAAVPTAAGLCAEIGGFHTERRKPAGVVAIAVARELAELLWEAATLDA